MPLKANNEGTQRAEFAQGKVKKINGLRSFTVSFEVSRTKWDLNIAWNKGIHTGQESLNPLGILRPNFPY